jgi:hypothetical protein
MRLLCIVALVAACGSSSGPPDVDASGANSLVAQGVVGPEGGQVGTSDGPSIILPPHAVAIPTTIQIFQESATPPQDIVTSVSVRAARAVVGAARDRLDSRARQREPLLGASG